MPRTWVYDPHSGGVKIPMAVRERTKNRILAHASKHYAGKYTRLGEPPTPFYYLAMAQHWTEGMDIVIRTTGDPEAVAHTTNLL